MTNTILTAGDGCSSFNWERHLESSTQTKGNPNVGRDPSKLWYESRLLMLG